MKKTAIAILLALSGCSNPDPNISRSGDFLVIENEVLYIPSVSRISCNTRLRDRILIYTVSSWKAAVGIFMDERDCRATREKIIELIEGTPNEKL